MLEVKQEYIILWKTKVIHTHLIVMSSSWNFPSRAEPNWKVSEPRRAELGTSIFELKPSWFFFVTYSFFSSKLFFLGQKSVILRRKSIIYLRKTKIEWKCRGNKEKMPIFRFSSWNIFFELKGKRSRAEPSRAELKIIQLELWLEPAQLGLSH